MDNHYTPLSRSLHWLTAVAITVMLTLGLMMVFTDLREAKHVAEAAHIGVGFFVFFVVVWRVGLRAIEGFPTPVSSPLQRAARYLHYVLLMVILLLVISGPLYLFTENEPLSVFGWFNVVLDWRSMAVLHELAEAVHKVLGTYMLPTLLFVHMVGGIYHFYRPHD